MGIEQPVVASNDQSVAKESGIKLSEEQVKIAESIMLTEEEFPEGFLLFNEYI